MKNPIFKSLLLIALYFQSIFSMEDPNHPNNKPILNDLTSEKTSQSQSNETEAQLQTTNISTCHYSDSDLEKLESMIKLLSIEQKENLLKDIQKILSTLILVETIITSLKSINKLNKKLSQIPNFVRYISSIENGNDESLTDIILANEIYKNLADNASLDQPMFITIGVTSPKAIATSILCKKLANQYETYINDNLPYEDKQKSSTYKPKEIKKIFASNILHKNIKDFSQKLSSSNDFELRVQGQWFLTKLQLRKMCNITDIIANNLIKIISYIRPELIFHPNTGEFLDTNIDKILKKISFNTIFNELLHDIDYKNLSEEIDPYIKSFYNLLTITKRAIEFIRYTQSLNRFLNQRENIYLISITNPIISKFEENKENYRKLYKYLLSAQQIILQSIHNKKTKLILLKKYNYNILVQIRANFPEIIFEPKNTINTSLNDNLDSSDNYVEYAKKFEEKNQANKLIQLKKQTLKAKQKRKKHFNSNHYDSKEDSTEIIRDNILNDQPCKTEEDSVKTTSDNILNDNQDYSPACIYSSNYDTRCHQWFKSQFKADPSPYHTFPLETDYFIHKYGHHIYRKNQSHLGEIDTQYYIHGKIVDENQNEQLVTFHITYDSKGKIYHRGYVTGYLEPEQISKHGKQNVVICLLNKHSNQEMSRLAYTITDSCITLKDKLNKRTIILFIENEHIS